MSKGRHRFTEAELRRAVKAAESAGMKIGRVEIEGAKFRLSPAIAAPLSSLRKTNGITLNDTHSSRLRSRI